jgi:hypothetical protein
METLSRATLAIVLLACGVTLAQDRPKLTITTIFVDGIGEPADNLRDKMEKWSCLKLATKKEQADAIMTVEEREMKRTTSYMLTKQDGEQIWWRTEHNSLGQGLTAETLLNHLAKDACPPHWCGTAHCLHLK